MLQALAHDARGRRDQARHVLAHALTEGPEPDGYARLFLDESAPMVELLRDAHRHGQGSHHPARLLGLRADGDAASAEGGRSTVPPAGGELSERELQVLRLLDSDLSGPQIARELFVSHNTLRSHTKHIFTKLDVTNRRAAVSRAHERGLM
jgi:LuxR family maltose regulon positive regulatory protein